MEAEEKYTKRARPTVVYGGMLLIFLNWLVEVGLKYTATLQFNTLTDSQLEQLTTLTQINLPPEFYITWASITSVYAVGRSVEKRGVSNKVVSAITGNK